MTDERIYKRFMVFGSNDYEAQHGIGDLCGEFDTLDEAMAFVEGAKNKHDMIDIFDRIEGKII